MIFTLKIENNYERTLLCYHDLEFIVRKIRLYRRVITNAKKDTVTGSSTF